jgi:hypothetical protein
LVVTLVSNVLRSSQGLSSSATSPEHPRDALAEHGATVEGGDSDNWHVKLSDRGPDFTVLLGTLQSCLDHRGIASVRVVMGDQTYLMEVARAPQAP